MEIFYFGTSLNNAGHYFWLIDNDQLVLKGLSFPKGEGLRLSDYKNWPFNPEEMPASRRNGDVEYNFINGYSIIAICGSCKDNRSGSKSVFFTEQKIDKEQFKILLTSKKIVNEIITKMPFEIKW